MARQSIPANPIDEQILALNRQIANSQNEIETLKDDHEARVKSMEHTITQQSGLIDQLTHEKQVLIHDFQSIHASKVELEKEMTYLQEQLELMSQEKAILKEQVIARDHQLSQQNVLESKFEEQEARLKVFQDDLEQSRVEASQLRDQLVAAQKQQDRISELEDELEQMKLIGDISKVPPTGPVLRLRDLQCRIESLSVAFRT